MIPNFRQMAPDAPAGFWAMAKVKQQKKKP